jgi:hypothetical protein
MTPALFTMTSTRPYLSRAEATNCLTLASSVTSNSWWPASPPASWICLATRARRSVRRAPRKTRWPFAARRRAVASPMPLLAPVMSTTLDGVVDIESVIILSTLFYRRSICSV